MLISDPIKAFNLSPEQAKSFARKLREAASRYEASYISDDYLGHYTLTIYEAANNDPIVSLALEESWNECMNFIKSQGFYLPNEED